MNFLYLFCWAGHWGMRNARRNLGVSGFPLFPSPPLLPDSRSCRALLKPFAYKPSGVCCTRIVLFRNSSKGRGQAENIIRCIFPIIHELKAHVIEGPRPIDIEDMRSGWGQGATEARRGEGGDPASYMPDLDMDTWQCVGTQTSL